MEHRAYKNDLPGSRRSPCLGCGAVVVTARHPHVQFGGRRDGSLLLEIDVEPLISQSNDPDALYGADDLFLLGFAHRRCRLEARRRLMAGEVELPDDLPQLIIDDVVPSLPALHTPPTLERCPFCDGAESTDEHVFPQWLLNELSSIGNLIDRGSERGPRSLQEIDVTAPICQICNNRWLSVIENDTKPLLAPMIRGEERTLGRDEQERLATWGLKTAMMLDLASGSPVIPTGYFQALRQQREPFDSTFIWLGAYSGSNRAIWAQHSGLHMDVDDTEPANGFVTTFTAFRVIFQVVGHFTRGGAEFSDNRIYKDALVQVWPPRSQSVEWPPNRLAFNDEWLVTLANSISG